MSGKNPGLGLIILGVVLVFGSPFAAIASWYLFAPKIVPPLVGIGAPLLGVALIVSGAVQNSRRQRQLPSPPISN